MTQCKIQAGNITNNKKVQAKFFLLEFSVMKTVTWECSVYESTERSCDMIIGRDILTALVFFKQVIKVGNEQFER